MKRLGMPISDDTILRQLKRRASAFRTTQTIRVAGIDDWARRKGFSYGTIVVDLERREVVDVLQERSTAGTAGCSLRTLRARNPGGSATGATGR